MSTASFILRDSIDIHKVVGFAVVVVVVVVSELFNVVFIFVREIFSIVVLEKILVVVVRDTDGVVFLYDDFLFSGTE